MPAGDSTLVDFFLVGAAKAGSTSLHKILDSHPRVFMCEPKEPNFFTSRQIEQHAFLSSVPTVSSMADYHRLFAGAGADQLLGEASVSYLAFSGTARKIFEYNPAARIIISLRDPVMRAISHHSMDVKLGFCRHSLEDIFQSPSRYPDHFSQYFDNGLYHARVKEYRDTFPARQIHIILFPELASDQRQCASTLFSFLGLDTNHMPAAEIKENIRIVPRNRIYGFLYQSGSLRSALKRAIPRRYLSGIKSRLFSPAEKPAIDEGLMQDMYRFFQRDLDELTKLLGVESLALSEHDD